MFLVLLNFYAISEFQYSCNGRPNYCLQILDTANLYCLLQLLEHQQLLSVQLFHQVILFLQSSNEQMLNWKIKVEYNG